MKMRVDRRHAWAALLVAMLAAPAHAELVYTAQLLDLPGAMLSSRAWGLADGRVVGEVRGADNVPKAVVWDAAGVPQPLAGAGAFESSALAISGATIAGYRATAATSTEFEALRWSDASSPALAVPGPAGAGVAARAAAGSFVAGSTDAGAFVQHTTSGAVTTYGAAGSVAHGVAADGTAVGSDAAGLPTVFNGAHAGTLDVLASRAGAEIGTAFAILGAKVVGFYEDPDTFLQKAFASELGGATSTLFDGAAFALNAAGDVVGADFDAGVAMLYSAGTAYDINELVVGGLGGFTLTQARAIDDLGRIVAFGVDAAGVERAFLLSLAAITPGAVPLPPTVWLAALALAMLGAPRRRP